MSAAFCSRAVLLALVLLTRLDRPLPAQQATHARPYELVVPPAPASNYLTGINRVGLAIGYSSLAFAWRRSTGLVTLAPLPGWSESSAYDVDNVGMVVGASSVGSTFVATRWSATGSALEIAIPNATSSSARCMNNAGVVLGYATVAGQTEPWVWDAVHGARLLGALGLPDGCSVADINEAAQFTGGQAFGHAYRFDLGSSTFTSLGTLGGAYSAGRDLNNRGHVVGWAMPWPGYFDQAPFRWTPEEGMQSLGTLAPPWEFLFQGAAHSVNDEGLVVGTIRVAQERSHAFLWDEANGMRDLNRLVSNRGPYELVSADHISNTGWMVARALDTSAGNAPLYVVLRPR